MTAAVSDEVAVVVEAPARRRLAALGGVVRGRVRLPSGVASLAGVVGADARRWWLVAEQPPSLRMWLAGQSPSVEKVPDRSAVLRVVWVGHNWTFGVAAVAVSVVLLLAGGLFRWLGGHPVRFWTAVVIAAATGMWLALA